MSLGVRRISFSLLYLLNVERPEPTTEYLEDKISSTLIISDDLCYLKEKNDKSNWYISFTRVNHPFIFSVESFFTCLTQERLPPFVKMKQSFFYSLSLSDVREKCLWLWFPHRMPQFLWGITSIWFGVCSGIEQSSSWCICNRIHILRHHLPPLPPIAPPLQPPLNAQIFHWRMKQMGWPLVAYIH